MGEFGCVLQPWAGKVPAGLDLLVVLEQRAGHALELQHQAGGVQLAEALRHAQGVERAQHCHHGQVAVAGGGGGGQRVQALVEAGVGVEPTRHGIDALGVHRDVVQSLLQDSCFGILFGTHPLPPPPLLLLHRLQYPHVSQHRLCVGVYVYVCVQVRASASNAWCVVRVYILHYIYMHI